MVRTVLVAVWVLLNGSPSVAQQLPAAHEFRAHLLAVIDSYPTDGTHAYHWPKKGSWAGIISSCASLRFTQRTRSISGNERSLPRQRISK